MSDFAERIKKRNEQFFIRANKTKKAVAFGLLGQVVLGTPVDTGRARGNWQVTSARPAQGVLERDDKSGAGALREGNRTIQGTELEDDVWMSNNLPYIYGLAYEGRSKQVNPGWFRNAVDNFRSLINRAWRSSNGER